MARFTLPRDVYHGKGSLEGKRINSKSGQGTKSGDGSLIDNVLSTKEPSPDLTLDLIAFFQFPRTSCLMKPIYEIVNAAKDRASRPTRCGQTSSRLCPSGR